MIDFTIEVALWRLTWKLRRTVPGPRRREIRRALRADLRTTAAEVDAVTAVRRLGDLDHLAATYADAERGEPGRPDPIGGTAAAGLVLVLLTLLNGRRVMAVNSLPDYADFDPWRWALPGPSGSLSLFTVAGDIEHGLLVSIAIHQPAYLILPLMAFAVVARPWRSITNRRPPQLGWDLHV
jgi:hypothetical protein